MKFEIAKLQTRWATLTGTTITVRPWVVVVLAAMAAILIKF